MHVTFRFPLLSAVLLLLAAPWAAAQSLPDPVAPAVVGPPLDQIRPVRPHHGKSAPEKAAAETHHRPRHLAAAGEAVHRSGPTRVALAVPEIHGVPPAPRMPPELLDARPVPRPQVATAVTTTARIASRPLGPGYFSSDDYALVRKYYATTPVSEQAAKWKVGEPIPADSALTGVPDDVRAALPPLPPGHQYVEVDGEVVLVAVQSRVVVDGISRGMH